ncbi:GDSL-type esterase/lipase family protein [Draconibacterium sediminis]|uniref:Sialate O-acetylesterase n=1 Tax=Draconibacterium sediminis TaxID=1544798 RepID=A0A0D8JAM3_9BACT|nr:GDSL-type esterase/lipase family protein [Draconibacterium sediminis]KJF42833.1 sialate O-acetylesterase [Draconibacterium sediminis]
MKQIFFALLLLLISVAQLTAQDNTFSTYYNQRLTLFEKLPDTPNEIIMLGNSITDGCEWSELFQNPNIKNRGISGDITEGVLYRLDEVTRSKPAKVFLLIGINDLARNIPADTVFQNICKIASSIRESSPSTLVYVQSILPVNPSFRKFSNHVSKTNEVMDINEKLNRWCNNNNVEFVDLFSSFTEDNTNYLNPNFTNDGLHLTAKGYLKWAEIISSDLEK